MAGEIRPGGISGQKPVKKVRKLWSLQDRSVVSVHLLKANLAEDGCEEAQLDVGKRLLNDCNTNLGDSAIQRENARLAVYWFIKSSEQGNEDATRYLQECYDSGQGITCQNILDVKSCITTPKNEKLTFKAARLLYAKLCNGEDFITTAQLQCRLESKKYQPKVRFGTTMSPSDSPTSNHQNHDNETSSPFLTEDEDDKESTTSSSESDEQLLKTLKLNEAVKLTMNDLLNIATKFNEGDLPSVSVDSKTSLAFGDWSLWSPWSAYMLQLTLFLYFTNFISAMTAYHLVLTYFSLWTSYNFMLGKQRRYVFLQWSNIFRSALKEDIPWSDIKARSSFEQKYFHPYLVTGLATSLFFCLDDSNSCLKCLLSSISLLSLECNLEERTHSLEFLVRSHSLGAVWVVTLLGRWYSEWLMVSATEKDEDHGEIQSFLSIIDGNGKYLLDILILSIIAIAMFSIRRVVKRHREQHRSQMEKTTLLLQLMCLVCWLNLYLSSWDLTTVEVTCLGMSLLAIFVLYKFFNGKLTTRRTFVAIVMIVVSVMPLLTIPTFIVGQAPAEVKTQNNFSSIPVSWTNYERNCHRSAWKRQSIAATEIYCTTNYLHRNVNWTGKLSYVKLLEQDLVDTKLSKDKRPFRFEILLNIGRPEVLTKNEPSSPQEDDDTLQWKNWLGLLPSFFNSNSDTMALTFAPVVLLVSTENFNEKDQSEASATIISYRTDDILEFSGKLTRNAGGFKPEIGLVETITCVSCKNGKNSIVFKLNQEETILTQMQNWTHLWKNALISKMNIWPIFESMLNGMSD